MTWPCRSIFLDSQVTTWTVNSSVPIASSATNMIDSDDPTTRVLHGSIGKSQFSHAVDWNFDLSILAFSVYAIQPSQARATDTPRVFDQVTHDLLRLPIGNHKPQTSSWFAFQINRAQQFPSADMICPSPGNLSQFFHFFTSISVWSDSRKIIFHHPYDFVDVLFHLVR